MSDEQCGARGSNRRLNRHCTIVFAGRRDNYEVPKAFRDAGWVVTLVTDVAGGAGLARLPLPGRWRRNLRQRSEDLKGIRIVMPPDVAFERIARTLLKRPASVWSAERLGRVAAEVANRRGGLLLAYSTYAYEAFPRCRSDVRRLLFQMHPHADACVSVVEGLTGVRRGCDANVEWEFRLTDDAYRRYRDEWRMADGVLCASSYTRRTLIAAGADPAIIAVVPYGATVAAPPVSEAIAASTTVRALFVGSFVRRKGALDLARAALGLRESNLEIHACGRGLAEPEVTAAFDRAGISQHWNLSDEELARLRKDSDVFVFPSHLEGFGHVILESMLAGLPVIATDRTCAADLVEEGRQGWLVGVGDDDALRGRLRWCAGNPAALRAMRAAVRTRAAQFTWARFRREVAEHADALLSSFSPKE